MKVRLLVGIYLGSIVAANLLISHFGPWLSPWVALAFIGLDLTCRDVLHEAWEHKRLAMKMGLLILAGSLLTYLLNHQALRIALASTLAFGASALIDTAVYHARRLDTRFVRANLSNMASSLVDSLIFPTIAFAAWMPDIVAWQFTAKAIGGWLWALILIPRDNQWKEADS